MFPNKLIWQCKYLLPDKEQPNLLSLRCKAFQNGDGVPKDYPCQRLTDWEVNDGTSEPPKECPNGCRFEYREGYEDNRIRSERLRKEGYDVPE